MSYLQNYSVMKQLDDDEERLCKSILGFIIRFKREHDGVSPTVREIVEATEMESTGTTHVYLKRLVSDGKIEMIGKNQPRGIMVVGGSWEMGSTRG